MVIEHMGNTRTYLQVINHTNMFKARIVKDPSIEDADLIFTLYEEKPRKYKVK